MDIKKKIRVCIIGGGAAGLCALRHFSKDLNIFELEAFEQTGNIGGTWVYSENTGLDENGLPIHSSMYRDLRTNTACEVMNFPDFRKMKGEKSSFLRHESILSYLNDYTDHFQVRKFIQFYNKVEAVRPEIIQINNEQIIVWHVQIKNLKTKQIGEKEFDAVIVGSGQFSDPNIPAIPGIETFPGKQVHSHTYRKSDEFSGKTVIVLGAGVSGVDIGVDVSEQANKVYLSHNRAKITARLHPKMIQVAGIERVEKNEFFLKDGNSVFADALIYCTGYKQTFTFLEESCGIKVDDNYVYPLYKHTINVNFPTMCFMGINTSVVSFNMFHVKAQYFQALLKKQFALPSKEEMLNDSKLKTSKKWEAHLFGLKQYDFYDSLTQEAGLESFPDFYRKVFEIYTQYRKYDLLNYKDCKIILSEDNTKVRHITYQ